MNIEEELHRVNYPRATSNENVTPRKFSPDKQIHSNIKNTYNTGESNVSLFERVSTPSIADKSSILNKSIFPSGFRSIGSSPFALFNSEFPDTNVSVPLRPAPLQAYARFQYRVKPQLRENHWLPVRSQYPAFVVSPFVETGRD